MQAKIRAIECALGEAIETNEELARRHPDWNLDEITEKTGVKTRRLIQPEQCASDLAEAAALSLFERHRLDRAAVDFLLFCTSAPDYALPTSACVLQERLSLPRSAGALDFNLGCSGFVYGLALSGGLIEAQLARNILLLTADAYSRYIHDDDRSTRALFGDAGSAALITADGPGAAIGAFDFGTDGRGEFDLIRPASASRSMAASCERMRSRRDERELREGFICMDGKKIFTFAISAVPKTVQRVLEKANLRMDDVDWIVFHQASRFMLEHLINKMKLPPQKVLIDLEDVGNTVSTTIPLVLNRAAAGKRFSPGDKILLCGFGVGLSWASCLLEWGY